MSSYAQTGRRRPPALPIQPAGRQLQARGRPAVPAAAVAAGAAPAGSGPVQRGLRSRARACAGRGRAWAAGAQAAERLARPRGVEDLRAHAVVQLLEQLPAHRVKRYLQPLQLLGRVLRRAAPSGG